MLKSGIVGLALVTGLIAFAAIPASSAQGPEVVRKVLLQRDLPTAGWSEALVSVEIPVGGREGRHTHPGLAMVYVTEGAIHTGLRRPADEDLQGRRGFLRGCGQGA